VTELQRRAADYAEFLRELPDEEAGIIPLPAWQARDYANLLDALAGRVQPPYPWQ